MHKYSYRHDTFLKKFLLIRDGTVIAQLNREDVCRQIVSSLNGETNEDEPSTQEETLGQMEGHDEIAQAG